MVDIVSTALSAVELIYGLGAEALRISILNSDIESNSNSKSTPSNSNSPSKYHINKNRLENIKIQFMTELELLSSSIDALLYKDLYAAIIEINSALSATYYQENARAHSLYEEVRKHAVMAYNVVPTFDKKILCVRLRILGVIGYYYQELYCNNTTINATNTHTPTDKNLIIQYILSEVESAFHMLFNESVVKRAFVEEHITIGLKSLQSVQSNPTKKKSIFSLFTGKTKTKTSTSSVFAKALSKQYDETQTKGYMSSTSVLYELASLMNFIEHRIGRRSNIPSCIIGVGNNSVSGHNSNVGNNNGTNGNNGNTNLELFTAKFVDIPMSNMNTNHRHTTGSGTSANTNTTAGSSTVADVTTVHVSTNMNSNTNMSVCVSGGYTLYVGSRNRTCSIVTYEAPNYITSSTGSSSNSSTNSTNNNSNGSGSGSGLGFTHIDTLQLPSGVTCVQEVGGIVYMGCMDGYVYMYNNNNNNNSNTSGSNGGKDSGNTEGNVDKERVDYHSVASIHERNPVRCMTHTTVHLAVSVGVVVDTPITVTVLITAGADNCITVWDVTHTTTSVNGSSTGSGTNNLTLFSQQLNIPTHVPTTNSHSHSHSQISNNSLIHNKMSNMNINTNMNMNVSTMVVIPHNGESYLFVVCYDRHTVQVWNINSGTCYTAPNSILEKCFEKSGGSESGSGHSAGISAMYRYVHSSANTGISGRVAEFLPSVSVLYTGGYDGCVCCWDLDRIFDVITKPTKFSKSTKTTTTKTTTTTASKQLPCNVHAPVPVYLILHKMTLQDTVEYIAFDEDCDDIPLITCIHRLGSRVYIGRDDHTILVYSQGQGQGDSQGDSQDRLDWSDSVRLVGIISHQSCIYSLDTIDGYLICGSSNGTLCGTYN